MISIGKLQGVMRTLYVVLLCTVMANESISRYVFVHAVTIRLQINFEMGANGQKASEGQSLLRDFEITKRVDSEGLLYLRHTSNNGEYLLRQLTFNDKRQFEKHSQLMQQRRTQLSGCKFLAGLQRVATRAQDQYCSTFYKVYALFEFGERTLEVEQAERKAQKRRFAQSELWSILASCILGLAHLQRQGIRHEALRANTLLISKEGLIRVYDPITTGLSSNYETLCTRRSTPHLYLSPELSESLRQESSTGGVNPYKSDIFTLGILILQAGLLQPQDECYRDDCTRLHWETLQYNLHRFQQNYSEDLAGLVELMLSKEEKARPDWLQLEERVMREEQNKTVSLLNISKDTRNSQVGRPAQGASFITSQVVPVYQSTANTQSQRHSHLYRPKPSSLPFQHQHTPSAEIATRAPFQELSPRIIFVAPSNIELTRPLRSVFPAATYLTQTKIDQNLIVVPEEERGFEAETPNNRNNSSYFDSNLKSGVQGNLPQYHPPLYHTYTPPPPDPPLVNTYGVSTFPSAPSAQGEYVVQRYKQGSEYKGYKLQGMRHGQGIFYYQDGGMYQGQWRYNKMQGKGKLFYQSGKLAYQGDWANDQFAGNGILYNEYPDVLHQPINYKNLDQIEEYWTKYEGQFREDLKSGHGILFLSNGQYYDGEFQQDMANGSGKFVRMDGEVITGRWLNNVFVG